MEKKSPKGASLQREIQEELEKFPELKPKLAAFWPLSENRKKAVSMIENKYANEAEILNLIESDDFAERNGGYYLFKYLNNPSEDFVKKALKTISTIIGEAGEEIDGQERNAKFTILARNIGYLGKDSLPLIKTTFDNRFFSNRLGLFHSLEIIGEDAIPFLRDIFCRKNFDWPWVLDALEKIGIKAVPVLKELLKIREKEHFIKNSVEDAIIRIENKQDKASETTAADNNDLKSKERLEIFASKKPVFASLHTAILAEQANKLNGIKKEMAEHFGNDFTGFVINGSFLKGYYEPQSDIDYIVISSNQNARGYFAELLKKNGLEGCLLVQWDVNPKVIKDYGIKASRALLLFNGVFFGDYKKMVDLQKEYLKKANEKDWEELRFNMLDNEFKTRIFKIKERLKFDEKKLEEAEQLIALRRVPPPLEEARKVIYKRNRQLNNV